MDRVYSENEPQGKIMNSKRHWWKRCGGALVMSAGITLGTGMAMAQTAARADPRGVCRDGGV
jgi:hypothetical protein